MTLVQLDFFDAANPNGAILHTMTSDDDYFESLDLKIRLRELGGGVLVVSRQIGFGVINSGIFAPEVFVRVLVPAIHPTRYIWGFWLDLREQKLISFDEKGGEKYTVGGPGPLFYLHRAVLWDHQLSGNGWEFDRDNGVVVVDSDRTVGNVLQFLRNEDANRPTSFLPDLTDGFTSTEDSAGVTWGSNWQVGPDYNMEMKTNYLDLLWQLQEAMESLDYTMYLGDTTTQHLRLDAWKNLGQNKEGSDFDTDVVLFKENVNIESELSAAQGFRARSTKGQASGTSLRKATHALVKGKDGVWDQAVSPSFDPGEYAKAVGIDYPSSDNHTILERAGLRWLRRQENADNEFAFEIKPGFDPEAGLYMPGPGDQIWSASPSDGHFWLGDIVTLRTGTDLAASWLDYAYEAEWVTGIDMILDTAVSDDTDEEAARSWHIWPQFNVERNSDNSAQNRSGVGGGAPHTHGPNPKLCAAGIECHDLTSAHLEDADPFDNGDAEDSGGGQWSGGVYKTTHHHAGARSYGAVSSVDSTFAYTYDPDRVFERGVRYVQDVWVRTDEITEIVELRFGVEGGDEGTNLTSIELETEDGNDGQNWARHRVCWTPSADRTDVRFSVRLAQDSSDDLSVDDLVLYTAANNEHAGTSRRAARCNHTHHAMDIPLNGAAAGLDATDVQAGFEEITSLLTFPSADFLTRIGGEKHAVAYVTDAGSALTLDLNAANIFDVMLTDDCDIDFTGIFGSAGVKWWLIKHQDGTGGHNFTLPAAVIWPGGIEPIWSLDPDSVDIIEFSTTDGGTTIYGDVGGSIATPTSDPLVVREVGDTDFPTTELEFDADDFDVSDEGGGVTRVALAIGGGTVTGAELVALGVVGPILIADDHSTPIVFEDLLLTEDGDDFLYGDIGD